jgi:hypothetical protein
MRSQNLGQFGEGCLGIGQQGSHPPILDEGIGGKHEGVPAQDRFVGLQPIIGQTEAFLEIPVVDLNGLITNDKFCFTREVRLKLTWWRRALKQRSAASFSVTTLTGYGGSDEPSLDETSSSAGAVGRITPLGSGLSVVNDLVDRRDA